MFTGKGIKPHWKSTYQSSSLYFQGVLTDGTTDDQVLLDQTTKQIMRIKSSRRMPAMTPNKFSDDDLVTMTQ